MEEKKPEKNFSKACPCCGCEGRVLSQEEIEKLKREAKLGDFRYCNTCEEYFKA
ncbi:MAG: hypothetical protein QME66_08645 [Candidatus Eisenbacteria bacterium]|nr:hypothetical protein [Candidatus Eisenbacteria bacterium]